MNLDECYRKIWAGKLKDAVPPDQQHIQRVTWVAELFPEGVTGPLLDIGCGSGQMLYEAKKRGWKALGLDRNTQVVGWLRQQGYRAEVWHMDELPLATPDE